MKKANHTEGKMELPRALELLNALIDHMINDEGGQSKQVIDSLLSVGFTAEELTEDFCFSAGDVESVMEEDCND